MVIPGYDPDDVDELLESKLGESGARERLSESEWQSYQNGDARLFELLDDEQIDQLLEEES